MPINLTFSLANILNQSTVGVIRPNGGVLNINGPEESESSNSSGNLTSSKTDTSNADAAFDNATAVDSVDDEAGQRDGSGTTEGEDREALERQALESLSDKNNPLNAEFVETRAKLGQLGSIADELVTLKENLTRGATEALAGNNLDSFAQTVSRFNEVLDEAKAITGDDTFDDLKLTEVTDQASANQAAAEVLNDVGSGETRNVVEIAQEQVDQGINIQQTKLDGVISAEIRNIRIDRAEESVDSQNQTSGAALLGQGQGLDAGAPTVQDLINPAGQGLQGGVLGNLLAGNKLSAFDDNVRRQIDGLAQVRNSLKTKV